MIDTLKKGDLIGVAYNNYIFPAIYMKKGSRGNFHFYLAYSEDRLKYLEERIKKGKKPHVDFINRHGTSFKSPIVRISKEDLTDEQRDLVSRHFYALENAGIL